MKNRALPLVMRQSYLLFGVERGTMPVGILVSSKSPRLHLKQPVTIIDS